MATFSLETQIACVEREIKMRVSVYPKLIVSHRMRPETAKNEIACMEAVRDTLRSLQGEPYGK